MDKNMVSKNKASMMKRLIVRYIQDEKLKPDDQLPAVEFFRRRFHCGTTTVAKAISELRDEGVLKVQDKVGVFVVDPNVDGHAGRVIGISVFTPDAGATFNILLVSLQVELSRYGCTAQLFQRSQPPPEGRFEFSIRDFPGLCRSIEEKSIDALIHLGKFDPPSMEFLGRHAMPEIFVGFLANGSHNCSVCDFSMILNSMCDTEAAGKARYPAVFFPQSAAGVLEPQFRDRMRGRPYVSLTPPRWKNEDLCQFGRNTAREFAALPEDERPDLLLFFDDFLANALLFPLMLLLGTEKMPKVMLLRNLQLPISYPPLPELKIWEIDIAAFARATASRFLDTLRAGQKDTGTIFFEPKVYEIQHDEI